MVNNKKNKYRPILVQGLRRDVNIFHLPYIKASVAQLKERLIAEQKVLGSNLSQGDIYSFINSFSEEVNQMLSKNNKFNNSSNSLVFGLQP